MKSSIVSLELLETTPDSVKVRLPQTDIQIQMSHRYFQSKLNQGYFKIRNNISISDLDLDYEYYTNQ